MVVVNSPAWASGGKGGIAPPRDPARLRPCRGRAREARPRRRRVGAVERGGHRSAGSPAARDPAKYTAMVKSAYKAIKAVQPRDVVVTGAHDGQQLRLHRAALRARAEGPLRRDRHAHGHGVPGRRPEPHVPRARRPPRPLHLLELSRDVRGHEGARRRRQADLDDRAGLEHAGPLAGLLHRPASTPGQKPLGVTEADQARFLTEAYQCLAERPVHRRRLLVRPAGHPGQQLRRRLRPLPPQRQREARRPARSRRSSRGITPKPCGGIIDASGPQFDGQGAAGRPRLPQGDGHRRQGDGRRRRGHQGHRAADRRQVLPLLRRRPREDADPLGVARVAQRDVAQADVHRRGRGRQRGRA